MFVLKNRHAPKLMKRDAVLDSAIQNTCWKIFVHLVHWRKDISSGLAGKPTEWPTVGVPAATNWKEASRQNAIDVQSVTKGQIPLRYPARYQVADQLASWFASWIT